VTNAVPEKPKLNRPSYPISSYYNPLSSWTMGSSILNFTDFARSMRTKVYTSSKLILANFKSAWTHRCHKALDLVMQPQLSFEWNRRSRFRLESLKHKQLASQSLLYVDGMSTHRRCGSESEMNRIIFVHPLSTELPHLGSVRNPLCSAWRMIPDASSIYIGYRVVTVRLGGFSENIGPCLRSSSTTGEFPGFATWSLCICAL
jgi:hypothetical protein